ncbi:MAG TPA: thymidine phosphorylase [Actinomycetota bacterium]|nr:thymidine phosphorylase [Actinomycetota bacterium]
METTLGDPRDVVAAKRDGRSIPAGQLEAFVQGYARGEIPDHLAAAFLMAAFIRGLDAEETLALTRAMIRSGRTLPLEGVPGPKVDKHSTGGVADGVTLVFAPLAAALGLRVAKLSGRGLGHTGGTLDKLESIPGLRTDLSPEELERQVAEVGCAVAAQSAELVPADGALYALRDATATVPSIPLIAASVMSKKLAVESDLILLDVKAGSGAFMKTVGDAVALARACMDLAAGFGRRARAAVTDMSQPLGQAVGNALDVAEAVDLLAGRSGGRVLELVLAFAAEALATLEGVPPEGARARAERALAAGEALDRFRRMVEAQGGDPRVVDDPWAVLPRAPVVRPIEAQRSGVLAAVDAEEIGRASVDLGAGRRRKGDRVDPAVGIVFRPKVGDRLERGEPLGEVHARDEDAARAAARRVLAALRVSDRAVEPPPLVHGWFG